MSLVFSDTTTYKGIIQLIEKELGMSYGDISGDAVKLKEVTVDVNTAWDLYIEKALSASGQWQFDDSNQTDYPIIYTNIVSGQQSYSFTVDENSNLILDIYKVGILPNATATQYQDIDPIDQQSDADNSIFSEEGISGIPSKYDKTANGIIFDVTPNYNATNGLKVAINREPSYFISTDTTKKPGCPGIHHRYFVMRAAYEQARRNNVANVGNIYNEVLKYEGDEDQGIMGSIQRYFSRRQKDVTPVFTPEPMIYE